jgi:hypothetical protein
VATTLAPPRPEPVAPAPGRYRRDVPWAAFAALVAVGIVLRAWGLAAHSLSFDETFTAMAARRSPGDLFHFLRIHDAHPPLDYLLRAPFAATGSDVLVRLPSVVFSSLALVLFAWWMRGRGRVGLLATGLVAISGFEVFYGREARMYALMELVGVVVAIGTDRWLARRSPGAAALVAGALLVGVFTHVSTLVLAAGVFWAAGFARDRAAWWWRAAVAAPVLVWAAAWGTTFAHQASGSPAGWIPRTSVDSFFQSVAQPLSFSAGLAPLIVLAIAGGCVLAARSDPDASPLGEDRHASPLGEGRRLARVGAACFVGPVLLAAAVGSFGNFFQPRTLAFAAWAPLLAIAVLVDAAWRRRWVLGVAALALVAAVALPATAEGVRRPGLDSVDATDAHLRAVVQPGDVVIIRPQWMRSLVEWNLGVQRDGSVHAVAAAVPDAFAMRIPGPPTGRTWLVEADGNRIATPGAAKCAPEWNNDATRVRCIRGPSG